MYTGLIPLSKYKEQIKYAIINWHKLIDNLIKNGKFLHQCLLRNINSFQIKYKISLQKSRF